MTKPTPTHSGIPWASIRVMLVAVLTCIGLLGLAPALCARTATAAEVSENIVTSATLSSATIRKNSPVELHMEFRLPNNTIHEGDTSTITLPEGFAYYTDHDFDVTAPDGSVVAHAVISKKQGTLQLTYAKYVESHSDITGSITASFILDNAGKITPGTRDVSVTIDGHVVPVGKIEVLPEGSDDPTEIFAKYGYQRTETANRVAYVLRVNGAGKNLKNVRVEDKLTTPAVTIDRDSLRISRGDWTRNENGQFVLTNTENVTTAYEVKYDADSRGFTVDLGDLDGKGVAIGYDIVVPYTPQHNETFLNSAVMHHTDGEDVMATDRRVTWKSASGEANGYNYGLRLTKLDADTQAPLAGAKFNVTRDRSGATVGMLVTDEHGNAELSGLLRDDYTITETEAPEGYDRNATPIKLSADSFTGEDNTAQLTVTNTKTPEPEPEPTPEPEQPTPQPKKETPQPTPKTNQTAQQKPKAAKKSAKTPLAATGADSVAALSVAMAALAAGLLIMRRLHKD